MKRLAALAGAVAILASCGGSDPAPPPAEHPSALATTFVTGQPPVGVAVERPGRVELVGLDGDVVGRIPGASLAYAPDRKGAVLSERGVRWLFRPRTGRFVRLPALHVPRARVGCRRASRKRDVTLFLCSPRPREQGMSPSAKTVELRRGAGPRTVLAEPPFPAPAPGIGPIGHWESAELSPDGRTVLAQWSAECEIPLAFLIPAAGGKPRPIAGTLRDAVDSIALGWAPDGRAVVWLPTLGCGGTHHGPGVYFVALNGTPTELIAKGRDIRAAQLWGGS